MFPDGRHLKHRKLFMILVAAYLGRKSDEIFQILFHGVLNIRDTVGLETWSLNRGLWADCNIYPLEALPETGLSPVNIQRVTSGNT
jgi:hypothetical protein